jgi:geranylgeranyl diphosphate synthase, type I
MAPDKSDTAISSLIEPWMTPRRPLIDGAIAKYFPRKVTEAGMVDLCGPPSYPNGYDLRAVNEGIYTPGWDLLDRGGKRWRPLLMTLVIEALGKDPAVFADFLAIPEVVHNGTLIVDDIEDGSELRRGAPCIHIKFGVDWAVNAGNTMYYDPLLPLLRHRGKVPTETLLDLYEVYLQEMINISHGQGTDLYWHRGLGTPTVDQYLQMCACKTGTLARMGARMGAILAGGDPATVAAVGKFAESIAVAFQIQDDVLNLKESVGKEFGEDIKEGKRSLLVIRALEQLPPAHAKRLTEILALHQKVSRAEVTEAIALIRTTDAFDYAKSLSRKIIEGSWTEMKDHLAKFRPFPGFQPDGASGLRALADFLIQRTS